MYFNKALILNLLAPQYTETSERHQAAQHEAEEQLHAYRQKRNSLPDVSLLKSELLRLQEAYTALQLAHQQEVDNLEDRLAELVAEIATRNERRRFQLIPDRTYIVKKASSPTVSNTSIGSVSRTTKREHSASPPCDDTTSKVDIGSPKSDYENYKTLAEKLETVEKSRNQPFTRPKSCTTRKILQGGTTKPDKPSLSRPKSCWSDNKRSETDKKRPVTSSGNVKPKFSTVSSRIDTGRNCSVLPDTIVKYKAVRNGSLGSSAPPWQGVSKGQRGFVGSRNTFLR